MELKSDYLDKINEAIEELKSTSISLDMTNMIKSVDEHIDTLKAFKNGDSVDAYSLSLSLFCAFNKDLLKKRNVDVTIDPTIEDNMIILIFNDDGTILKYIYNDNVNVSYRDNGVFKVKHLSVLEAHTKYILPLLNKLNKE